MLTISDHAQIYVYISAVDMRNSVQGLTVLLVDVFQKNPQTGDLFVFTNKQRNRIKILLWDKNGFVLYYKQLAKGKFNYRHCPQADQILVTQAQLKALLIGLDFYLLGQYPQEMYEDFF